VSYDPNAERFTYIGHDGQWHTHEYDPEHAQWLIGLRNRMRLADLEQRRQDSALNEPEFKAKTEVRQECPKI
jgi:hypothetical protein